MKSRAALINRVPSPKSGKGLDQSLSKAGMLICCAYKTRNTTIEFILLAFDYVLANYEWVNGGKINRFSRGLRIMGCGGVLTPPQIFLKSL